MKRYTVLQTATGVSLFDGEAKDERHALDLMARDAGYRDYAHAVEVTGEDEGIAVTEYVE